MNSKIQYNNEYKCNVIYDDEFVNPFSIPKEYRIGKLGFYVESPEEALEAFMAMKEQEDSSTRTRKARRAFQALALDWNKIDLNNKKKFVKKWDDEFGINSLLLGSKGDCMNMGMMFMLLCEGEESMDDLSSILVFCILLGMKNKGPEPLQNYVDQLKANNEAYKNALVTVCQDDPVMFANHSHRDKKKTSIVEKIQRI